MNASKVVVQRGAAVLLACFLLVLVAGPSRAQQSETNDRVVESLTSCDLGGTTSRLSLLFLLDESGSLATHDPANKRVDGTIEALKALERLATRFSEIPLTIDVAIHGFHGNYETRTAWLTLGTGDALKTLSANAERFRRRNVGLKTDYREAINGAAEAFKKRDRDTGDVGCKALVWFTDGEYDSENNSSLTLGEIDEITDELCVTDGLVDQLREMSITIIAIGLSNKETKSPPDMSLVKAIASGDSVTTLENAIGLPDGQCGSRPGTGDLSEKSDPDELIETFEEILADSLFETVEVRPGDPATEGGHPPLPCTPSGDSCSFEFFLGPWVDQFTIYFKIPASDAGNGLSASLSPPGVSTPPINITMPDGPLQGVPGVAGESPSSSWRMLTGIAEQAGDIWNGVWRIQFEGPGAAEAKTNIELFEGTLGVRLLEQTIDRADPTGFGTVGLELWNEDTSETSTCNKTNYPLILSFTGTGILGTVTGSAEFKPDEACIVHPRFLLDLLTADTTRDADHIDFVVTPSLRAVEHPAVPLLEFGPSHLSLSLENMLTAVLAEGSQLDRTNSSTFETVGIELTTGGRTIACDSSSRYPVNLVFTGSVGDLQPITASGRFVPGQPCTVPAEFLHKLATTGSGKDSLSVTFDVTPSMVVDPALPPLEFKASPVSIWLQDALIVRLSDGSRLDRADPESFNNIGLQLFLGSQRFDPAAGTHVTLSFSADLNGNSVTESITYTADEPFTVPSGFLQRALSDGSGLNLVRLSIQVTPSVESSNDDPDRYPTYEPSTIHVWLHDHLDVRRVGDSELDRDDSRSFADIEVDLLINGQPLSDTDARVALEFAATVNGNSVATSRSYPVGGPYLVPHGLFKDLFEVASDTDLLLLSVNASPRVTVDGSVHPGYGPSVLQFSVRTGEGFPRIVSISATDINDTGNATLTVEVVGPNDGTGKLDIRSISGLPADLPGTITLTEPKSCEIPSKERAYCTVELSASFTANRTVELDVDLALSGDRTKVPGRIIQDSVSVKPFKMSRPLNTANFITRLLLLLVLFVAVQVFLRVLFTTRLARWEALEIASRWSTLRVRINKDGYVTAEGGGQMTVDPASTMFATELENRSSSAQLGDITFSISWMRTFLGETRTSRFVRSQRAVIGASSSTNHCIAPEGMDLSSKETLGIGLVGTQFLHSWVLQVSERSLESLADGEIVSADLLVIFSPFDEGGSSAFDQLEEISEGVTDVAGREIPNLIEHATSNAKESSENLAENGPDQDDGDWSDDPSDETDPFSFPPSTPPTAGQSGESSTTDDWLSDADDPFA
ncbi:MAG: VWA domain-containing protein [Gemmatimonadales bacterium]|nr:VWA domain-containing protein [Gemmatimonadales bacterium]